MRAKRKNISEENQQAAAIQITQRLIETEIFRRSKQIACYVGCQAEVDTNEIIRAIWGAGK